jgi:hypothetical protein
VQHFCTNLSGIAKVVEVHLRFLDHFGYVVSERSGVQRFGDLRNKPAKKIRYLAYKQEIFSFKNIYTKLKFHEK